jgi:hypothetical protein
VRGTERFGNLRTLSPTNLIPAIASLATSAISQRSVIVGLDARTKEPSPLVGESNISPESELSPKYISGIINLYIYILKKIIFLI